MRAASVAVTCLLSAVRIGRASGKIEMPSVERFLSAVRLIFPFVLERSTKRGGSVRLPFRASFSGRNNNDGRSFHLRDL